MEDNMKELLKYLKEKERDLTDQVRCCNPDLSVVKSMLSGERDAYRDIIRKIEETY